MKKFECDVLEVFFSAKTHKAAVPFRAIVSENKAWQSCVSSYLQRHLNSLCLEDTYKVSSSEEVEFLKKKSWHLQSI